MELNPEQKRAVETIYGPLLIIAGAGAGKTGVITERIVNLIKNGISPKEILAITFTNKAAKEMRGRVNNRLQSVRELNLPISTNERPFVSTFHALGVYILRENSEKIGLTKYFSIFDRNDSRKAMKEAMEKCSIDSKKFDVDVIINKISFAKGEAVNLLQYKDNTKDAFEEMIANIWEKYEIILKRENALDFDDLLIKVVQLFEKYPSIKEHYNNIWKYIHIDEYQDTNKVQYILARYLAGKEQNICVVGDADQNIYSWRGATIENILNFEKDYPQTQVVILEKNYRSTKVILAAANMIIEKNRLRKKKRLYTEREQGEKISLLVSYNENEEARTIADIAREQINNGLEPREIAVLYRTNFQSRVLEESFIKKNIPYQILGTRFFERKEIKDVISYVRASLNHSRDNSILKESWSDINRIINVPTRGIGKATLAKITIGQMDSLPNSMKEKVYDFFKLLADIGNEIKENKPSEVIKFIIQETGLEKALRKGDLDEEERVLNLHELVSMAAEYDHFDSQEKGIGIIKFLENVALATDQDELKEDKNAVRLMTVHAAKGLEFDTVFITGLEQELFPLKHLAEDNINEYEEEEERRLFYVALTRAKKKVYLSYAIIRTVYGAQKVNIPSEFIEDIEEHLIESKADEKPSGAKAIFIDY